MSYNPLFRPLVYFLLGCEQYFFGHEFIYWQAVGILLHMLVLWWLLNILWRIHPGILAAITCLFFSVLLANAELVTWQHVHGYLLCILFMLIAFNQILKLHQTNILTRNILLKLFTSLLLACFSHEIGPVYCLLFAFYFLITENKHPSSLIVAAPCFIYFAANLLDLHFRGSLSAASSQVFQPANVLYGLRMFPAALFWWAFIGLFPTLTFTEFAQRTFMYPIFISIEGYTFQPSVSLLFPAVLGLGLIILYIIYLKKYVTALFIKKNWKVWILLLSVLFSFAFLVCYGRAAVKGFERIMVENGVYSYFFWIFLTILIYSSLPFGQLKQIKRPVLKIFLLSSMTILILLNAYGTFRLNTQRNVQSYHQASLFKKIKQLVTSHSMENHFSFAIHPDSQNDLIKYRKRNGPSGRPYNSAELLYPQYYNITHPTYLFTRTENTDWQWKKQ
ncbi:MAG: hypothetical protein KAV87_43460 [Desulfobacteraceae bacterium]|nr:hypothetical protein [Desulfobacteraceae bacterium]